MSDGQTGTFMVSLQIIPKAYGDADAARIEIDGALNDLRKHLWEWWEECCCAAPAPAGQD